MSRKNRIMVFDVPASSSGALTILNQYYEMAREDEENEWIFVISVPELKKYKDIKVLKFPWIKKSWLHRLYFDNFVAHKLVKRYEANEVLSLQNIIIPKVNVKQTLYLHQSLPFAEKRFKITENFKFWIYQNIIAKMIYKSLRNADKIVVQTKWVMEAAIKKTNTSREKYIVEQPKINIEVKNKYSEKNSLKKIFFYPASGMLYKNHDIIIKACKALKKEGINNYEVTFTLKKNENKYVSKLYKEVKDNELPIKFIGTISQENVFDYYSKSTLIFPSYIETFGLPLLEAKIHNSPIIVSDCEFSHEILDDYSKVNFFNPFDKDELIKILLIKLK